MKGIEKMTITAAPLTTPQLIMLRRLKTKGWPADAMLLPYIWQRAGGDEASWLALAEAKLVARRKGRWELTDAGKAELKFQSVGKWF